MKGILCISILPIKQFDRTYIMHMEFCYLMMTATKNTDRKMLLATIDQAPCVYLILSDMVWSVMTRMSKTRGMF